MPNIIKTTLCGLFDALWHHGIHPTNKPAPPEEIAAFLDGYGCYPTGDIQPIGSIGTVSINGVSVPCIQITAAHLPPPETVTLHLFAGSHAYDAVMERLPRNSKLAMVRVVKTRGQSCAVAYFAVAEVGGIVHRMKAEHFADLAGWAGKLRSELDQQIEAWAEKLKKPELGQ